MAVPASLTPESTEDFDKGILPPGVFKNPITATALLEAVALFEIVGSKWMLAVKDKFWDDQIHEHCFDEVTHTKLVQDQAKKLRWELSDEDLIKETKVTKRFYQAIDSYLNKLSRRVFKMTLVHGSDHEDFALSAYSLLSFVIERRIMTIYPYFEKFGPTENVRRTAKRIITDEKKHLHFVGDHLPNGLSNAELSMKEMIQIEEDLAQTWIGMMKDEYGNL